LRALRRIPHAPYWMADRLGVGDAAAASRIAGLGAHPTPCGEFWHGEPPLVVIFWHGARISCIDLHLYSAPLDVVLCPCR
jgi:hypothetical protein